MSNSTLGVASAARNTQTPQQIVNSIATSHLLMLRERNEILLEVNNELAAKLIDLGGAEWLRAGLNEPVQNVEGVDEGAPVMMKIENEMSRQRQMLDALVHMKNVVCRL